MLEKGVIHLEEEKTFLIFKIGVDEFSVDVLKIIAISNVSSITRIPWTPKFIQGVINLRGKILPVINLRKILGFQPKGIDENTRIIIAEQGGITVGMIVDSLIEIMRISLSDIKPVSQIVRTKILNEYLQGIAKIGNRLIMILDLIKIITEKEIEERKVFKYKNGLREPLNILEHSEKKAIIAKKELVKKKN